MRRVLRPTTATPMARTAETTSQRKAIHPQGPLRSAFTSSVLPIPPYAPAGRSGRVPDTANHGRTNRLPSSTAAPATSNARPPAEIALIPAMARTRGIASNTFRYKCPRGRIHTAFVNINALWRPRPRHRSVPGAHVHHRVEDVLRLPGHGDLSPSIERRRRDVGRGPTGVARARPRLAVRSANPGRGGRHRVRRVPPDVRSRERPVQIDRSWSHVVRSVHDERCVVVQR